MSTGRLASSYLIVQGVAGLVWWVLLLAAEPVRDLFFPNADGWPAGRTLLLADVVMFGLVSILAGGLALRSHRWAGPVGWIALGATAYATLVAVGWLGQPIDHWLGAAAMAPTLLATMASVWLLHGSAVGRAGA